MVFLTPSNNPTERPSIAPTEYPTNNPTTRPTVPFVEHCIPDPICKKINVNLNDGTRSDLGIITLSNYINDFDIPGGQDMYTIFPSQASFRFNGTHTQTNDLDFLIFMSNGMNTYNSTTSLSNINPSYTNFDFSLTNNGK